MTHDAIIVGGGPAGLTAALYLGRCRRRTLVIDAGRPRNMRAKQAHGVFTRDGAAPETLLAEARRQLGAYPSVSFRRGAVVAASPYADGFAVSLDDGGRAHARRLLIAFGVSDQLPAIPGLAEMWGTGVHNCTYCHGYEERDRPIAVLTDASGAVAAAASHRGVSSDLALCTNGQGTLAPSDRGRIEAHGVRIIETPLARVSGAPGALALHFADGAVLERSALFMKSTPALASSLPIDLGCALDGPARVRVNDSWETSISGVYAAGDIAAAKKFVSVAAASGAEAAVAIDGALSQADFGGTWSGPLCGAQSEPPAHLARQG